MQDLSTLYFTIWCIWSWVACNIARFHGRTGWQPDIAAAAVVCCETTVELLSDIKDHQNWSLYTDVLYSTTHHYDLHLSDLFGRHWYCWQLTQNDTSFQCLATSVVSDQMCDQINQLLGFDLPWLGLPGVRKWTGLSGNQRDCPENKSTHYRTM